MANRNPQNAVTVLCIAAVAVVLLVCGAAAWYRAAVHSDVYRREGIDVSTWEVLWGARPAERTVNIK